MLQVWTVPALQPKLILKYTKYSAKYEGIVRKLRLHQPVSARCKIIHPCPSHYHFAFFEGLQSLLVKYSANSVFYQHIFAFYLRNSVLLAVFYLLTCCVLQTWVLKNINSADDDWLFFLALKEFGMKHVWQNDSFQGKFEIL